MPNYSTIKLTYCDNAYEVKIINSTVGFSCQQEKGSSSNVDFAIGVSGLPI